MDQPIWLTFLVAFVFMNVLLVGMAYMTWYERKVLAAMQDRVGPNRTGPKGLLQPIADGIKLLGKEDLIPAAADKWVFRFAPLVIFVTAIVRVAVIPFGDTVTIFGYPVNLFAADLNVGALFLLAFGSLGVYGIILGLSLVGVFLLAGTLSIREIMLFQSQDLQFGPLVLPNWLILSQPLAFVIFLIAAVAETNRAPFDLPEAETELVSGFHTEYSAFRFSFYFLGEYINMIIVSLFAAVLFLGGTDGPGSERFWGLGIVWLFMKVMFFLFFYVWLRTTLPRFRYDQLMGIAWKVLLPLTLLNILITAFIRLVGNGQVF